jgi:hypothetical protein
MTLAEQNWCPGDTLAIKRITCLDVVELHLSHKDH